MAALVIVLGALALIAAGAANAGSERANRHAAQRDAAELLKRAVLPAEAIPSATEPAGDDHFLSRPGQVPALVNLLDRHGWWTVSFRPTRSRLSCRPWATCWARVSVTSAAKVRRIASLINGLETVQPGVL